MLDLESAIKHCEKEAEKNEKECKNWAYGASQINDDENRKKQYQKHAEMWHECAKEHRQLAEWLRELKKLREFAHYVANSITAEEEEFDENPRFFGEVYCRKLHKLGIIKKVDNKWVYDEEVNADEQAR